MRCSSTKVGGDFAERVLGDRLRVRCDDDAPAPGGFCENKGFGVRDLGVDRAFGDLDHVNLLIVDVCCALGVSGASGERITSRDLSTSVIRYAK